MSIEIHRTTPEMAMRLMALNGTLVDIIRINETNLDSIEAFPDTPSVIRLEIMYSSTTKLPANLSPTLEHLTLVTNKISNLSYPLPYNLKEFICLDNALTELPPLPDGLICLDCSKNNLTVIPKLPKTLKIFNCSDNNNLNTLPDELPPQLRRLNLSGCNIKYLPYLPYSIDYNSIRGLLELPQFRNTKDWPYNKIKLGILDHRKCGIDYINDYNAPERAHRRIRAINRDNILLETYEKRAMHPKRIAALLADETADVDAVMQEYTAGL